MRRRRLRLLAGRVLALLAVPHQLRAARVPGLPDALKYTVKTEVLDAGVRLSRARSSGRRRPRERRLVARLHRVAGVCRQGAGRRRPQPGLEHHPPVRVSSIACRSSRWRISPTRIATSGEARATARGRPASPHAQRHPARRRQRARRGAERSVPALVLELQRAHHGDRAGTRSSGLTAPIDCMRPMVRWLMAARRQGRWGNTQENAWAMEALVDLLPEVRSRVPDFTALVKLGARGAVAAGVRRAVRRRRRRRDVLDGEICRRTAAPGYHAGPLRSRSRGPARSSTSRGCATPSDRAVPGRSRQRLRDRALVRARTRKKGGPHSRRARRSTRAIWSA